MDGPFLCARERDERARVREGEEKEKERRELTEHDAFYSGIVILWCEKIFASFNSIDVREVCSMRSVQSASISHFPPSLA